MKKALILLLVLAFTIAATATAFALPPASWNPPGPTYRDPALPPGPPIPDTPHGSYAATGDECEVCHSPHQAGSGGLSYKLLRAATRDAACDYCHVGAGAKTAKIVYTQGGVVVKTGKNGHEITTVPGGIIPDSNNIACADLDCFDCHSAHGAKALATDILKKDPAGNGGTDATDETTFCADCHNKNRDTATGGDSHIMAAIGTHSNADTNTCGGTSGVASSCHAAPRSSLYPHISTGDALLKNDEFRPSMDRACLRCHSSAGKAVGTDY